MTTLVEPMQSENTRKYASPQVMAVLNVSPESFFAESVCQNAETAISRGRMLAAQGADIIDIGGEATSLARFPDKSKYTDADRPSLETEIERVVPVIKALSQSTSCQLSVDTMRAEVAREAVAAGATIINDQSGFKSPEMRAVAAESGVDICVMHMQGTPATMQLNPDYPRGVVLEICEFFEQQVASLVKDGVKEDQIILDPGICFGKTIEHNYTILRNISTFKRLGFPVMIGLSRKSLMTRVLNKPAEQLLPLTVALNALVLEQGADIIRVHDVVEHRDLVDLMTKVGYR